MVPEKPGGTLSSRSHILAAVRKNRPPEIMRPDERPLSSPSGDLATSFEALARNNSSEILHAGPTEIESLLEERFGSGQRTASAISESRFGNLKIGPETAPHSLNPLDVFVCRGTFGVAENGAIWLAESEIVVRAAPFLAEHLVVLLDKTELVADMHDAYRRLRIDEEPFGLFCTGPSKTADIEQSLVVGAHGPRRHTIVLVSN